jgi:hypothetical protein
MRRRDFVVGLVAALAITASSACKKDVRCKHCGMKIEPASAWRAELVGEDGQVTAFDTPRCALQAWRSGETPAKSIRVQEYYDRTTKDGTEVRFVLGGDVSGPMGPDFVPVDPPRVSKYIQDHGAERAFRLEEVTAEVLRAN